MTAILGRFEKQPSEVLDYYVDFSDWFSNRTDAPASAVVVAEAGVTVVQDVLVGQAVRIVLSGGTAGGKYKVTVRLTTDATPAIVKEADFIVSVKEA